MSSFAKFYKNNMGQSSQLSKKGNNDNSKSNPPAAPFIAKSQTNGEYIQPSTIFTVQHLREDYRGPGPGDNAQGACNYPDGVKAFIDKGLAEQFARHYAYDRASRIGANTRGWTEIGGKEILSYLGESKGWGYSLQSGDQKIVETIWVQEVSWEENNPPYART